MPENPWIDLPLNPPFVLPIDEGKVRAANERWGPDHDSYLHLNELPEPFVGSKNAPVVLLSKIPGYIEEDLPLHQAPAFMDKVRRNLAHEPLACPFYPLAPEFRDSGIKWWKKKTKELTEVFGFEVVARSILNVLFFPYRARHFGHGRSGHEHLRLPSQAYSFWLVREAIKRRALIVHMYKPEMWLKAIPGLADYELQFKISNPQNPAISRGNLGDDFQKVLEAIRAAAVAA